MSEKMKQTNEDVSVVIDNTSNRIIEIINESQLNPAVVELILKNILAQITIIKMQPAPVKEGDANG